MTWLITECVVQPGARAPGTTDLEIVIAATEQELVVLLYWNGSCNIVRVMRLCEWSAVCMCTHTVEEHNIDSMHIFKLDVHRSA